MTPGMESKRQKKKSNENINNSEKQQNNVCEGFINVVIRSLY